MLALLEERESPRGKLDRNGFHSPRPCLPADDLAVGRIVVYDEEALGREQRKSCVDVDPRRHIRLVRGQADVKCRALALLALEPHAPAHELDDAPGYREPEPGAAVAARGRCVDLAERLEQPVPTILRNPDASVPDGEVQPA